MNRREFLQAGSLALAQIDAQEPARQKKPNVLFIMADQFRFDCLGANGNRIIQTPNLDRLAGGGANLTNTFVQSPVCVPSRISQFTGRYPHSHKNRVNYTPCDPREVMIQRILKLERYRTGSVGKLHFYPPTAAHARSTGFDEVSIDDGVPMTDRFSDYVRWRKSHDPNAEQSYYAAAKDIPPGKNPFRASVAYEFTPTHWNGMETVRLLRQFAASEEPFFLFSSFFKPHSPHIVPVPFDAMYDDVEIPLPKSVTLEDIRKLPLPLQRQIKQTPGYNVDRRRLQWMYRSYYASVSMVDREIGLILDELERSGRANETIVVFTTDHGDELGEHGVDAKNVFFESSVHVPMLVRFPQRIATSTYPQLIETVDLLPTILDLCGVRTPGNVEGRSFASLITGNPSQYVAKEIVFSENVIPSVAAPLGGEDRPNYAPFAPGEGVAGIRHPDAKMARTTRWKLNYYPNYDGELYDLQNDPGETRNLWGDPAASDVVQSLKGAILDWMITAGETEQIAPRWLLWETRP